MTLQFAILGMLEITSMSGYFLKKIFDRSVNYFWKASLSQIYRELASLEEKGFVTSSMKEQDDRPDKRMYSITQAGSQAFLEWLRDFPEVLTPPGRDEFLLRIFFGSRLGKEELLRQFRRYRDEKIRRREQLISDKQEIMELTKQVKPATPQQELCMRILSRRSFMSNEVLIQWAEESIRALEDTDFN
jgi:PadR family transcriptional regulator, regulatory protein AphA